MEWNQETLGRVNLLFREKWISMRMEIKTDRSNMSAIWNKYLNKYDVTIIREEPMLSCLRPKPREVRVGVPDLVRLINFKNEEVAGRLMIGNPDRPGQWLLVPREIAERILVFGMI
jgi:hypothetical protein